MARTIMSPEEIGELETLYQQHLDSMVRLRTRAKRHGIESKPFVDANQAAMIFSKRIREILNDLDQGWAT